jgi:hypothetical protein
MIRVMKCQSDRPTRSYSVRCDSKGRTGYWECENLGPASPERDYAGHCARSAGWIMVRQKWYCPECQRDGFVPKPIMPRRSARRIATA